MVKREQLERIELPVEQISFVPGPADHLRSARRLWTAAQRTAHATAAERVRSAVSSASDVTVTRFITGATFRRLVDVPGARLETVLEAWWAGSSHDDGHLRFDRLNRNEGLFGMDGSLRTSVLSRRVPVEMWLSPYHGCWSFLELTPQRATHPSRVYFRIGHDCLDRFVAALSAVVVSGADSSNASTSSSDTSSETAWSSRPTVSAPTASRRRAPTTMPRSHVEAGVCDDVAERL